MSKITKNIPGSNRGLERKDCLRRDLVANLAHDLRSPLTSIQGYLETLLLKNTELCPREREKYLEVILSNTIHISKLVDGLFQLSKLAESQIQPSFEVFSIEELVNDIILKVEPNAAKKDISIQVNFSQKLPFVLGDIGMIERAITNLLENAIHYTPSKGVVQVELLQKFKKIRIIISDTGCGISPVDLPYIFNRYYRKKRYTTPTDKSTGLGLAIAKRIVDIHNSTLKIKSQVGIGTKIYFELFTHNQ